MDASVILQLLTSFDLINRVLPILVGPYDAKEPFLAFYCLLGEFEFLIYVGHKMNGCHE
jgi:hypothetical protein